MEYFVYLFYNGACFWVLVRDGTTVCDTENSEMPASVSIISGIQALKRPPSWCTSKLTAKWSPQKPLSFKSQNPIKTGRLHCFESLSNMGTMYLFTQQDESKSKLCYDRRSVGQSVFLSSTHLGLTTRFLLLSELRVCWYGGLSLMREWVGRLQLLQLLVSAVIFGSESRGTRDHILLFQIRDSPNLEEEVAVFISPRNRVPSYTSRHWVPFSSPTTNRRATLEVLEPASTRCPPKSESELLYDWWFTSIHFILASSPFRLTARIVFLNWTPALIVHI
jgi:hypothetical protein